MKSSDKKQIFLKKLVRLSSSLLPAIALFFATSPCLAKLYEPQLPEELRS